MRIRNTDYKIENLGGGFLSTGRVVGELPNTQGVVRPAAGIILILSQFEVDVPLPGGGGEQREGGMKGNAVDTVRMEEVAGQRRTLPVPHSYTPVGSTLNIICFVFADPELFRRIRIRIRLLLWLCKVA